MNPDKIRATILKAIFKDDSLSDIVILKGGNALALLEISDRTSIDIDFAINRTKDIAEEEEGKRFENAIKNEFNSLGFVIHDYKFTAKPRKRKETTPPFWGGYKIEFKIIKKSIVSEIVKKYDSERSTNKIRAKSELIDPSNQKKIIEIDLSFNEYTENSQTVDFEGVKVFVYSPLMIIYEKMRALCQQMEQYPYKSVGSARARDLHDIYMIITNEKDDNMNRDFVINQENLKILTQIFSAKKVDLTLLTMLDQEKDKLEKDYNDTVVVTINPKDIVNFDFLFEYIKEIMSECYEILNLNIIN